MINSVKIRLLSLLIALLIPLSASAHEVGMRAAIQVRTRNGNLVTYSDSTLPRNAQVTSITITVRYSTGEAMAHGRISIFAPGDSANPWRTGVLNAQGEYTFSPNLARRGRWTVYVESEGHSNFLTLLL
ncbi:carboxypeptidase regulatory-like domain-containing protein [Spirulina subsalsa]|uniref:carboxypeptidase regulatory-like domain-containing protein n=1 Tax=Spirulina subsalsa TaxID=54311 RepID=UPI0002F344E6|nr:carboxypeptidase regulatory-like domain-containing protein [Spirulina subsalsa]